MGARLEKSIWVCSIVLISIHAPRMGARLAFNENIPTSFDFNPRAPHGGATVTGQPAKTLIAISIHAPRMGARRTLQK